MDEFIGQTIRGYDLHEMVGEGGFGAVYRATQTVVGREVVIKIILPHFANQAEFIRRFEAEAQLVARLEHPHIVPLYDYWRDPTGAYLVMRFLRGGTLRNALEKGPYTLKGTSRLLNQIGAALTVAHRNNVVHRDVKPSNILLDDDRNAYLTDFGIATTQIEGSSKSNSGSGRVSGSAGYISPEQINIAPISGRTDMYAMGIILYEMLTGHHPFADAKSAVALFIKHANEPLPPMDGIYEDVQKVVLKATAKNPDDRYADMMELANAFRLAAMNAPESPALATDKMEEFDSSIVDLTPTNFLGSANNPYKGLRAFQETDAGDFFGRENLTKQLIQRLDDDHELYRFLAVVGPSGSGKSSVVKAGVIPALRKGAIQNSDNWFIVEMVPGVSPFKELAEALGSIATSPIPDLMTHMKDPKNGGLNAILKKVLPLRNSELLLVVDQFEETFTQGDEPERTMFLEAIQQAITAQDSRMRIIVTLRADFYDRPLMVQNFSQLMQQRTEVVIPLTVDELERAITGPARQVKVFFQQGLAAAIVSQVNEQPGVLPMLQYALTELFERRDGSLLTTRSYQEIGGVLGALARRAEDIFEPLSPEKQEVTRQLFLRLVTLGEGTEDTRRRALQSELYAAISEPRLMQEVIDTFGKYRLLTYDRDPITRTPTVEVAHEALIREWQRLRDWLDESRSDIRLQRMLAVATKDWEDAGSDPSFLLRGGRLVQFEEWIGNSTINVSVKERAFLTESIEERLRSEEREQARAAREKAQVIRGQRQQRIIVIGAVLAAIVASGLSLLALNQSIVANNSASEANAARETAVLAQNDAQNQANTAISAQGDAQNQAVTATFALGEAVIQSTAAANALNVAQEQAATATNALGLAQEQAATATNALGLAQNQAYDNATAQAIAVEQRDLAAAANANAQEEAQFSQSLALSAFAQQLEDTNSALSLALALEANNISRPSLQVQRVLLSVVYNAPRAFRDNVVGIEEIYFDVNTNSLFAANEDGTVNQWDITGNKIIRTFTGGHTAGVRSLDVRGSGDMLVTGSADGTAILWDIATGDILFTLIGHTGSVNSVAFSPNGAQVATGSDDSTVILWSTTTGIAARTLQSDSQNAVNSVDYSPDSRQLLVIADDAMRLWSFSSNTFLDFDPVVSRVRDGEFSPDSTQILISGNVQTSVPQLWDAERRTFIRSYPAHTAPVNGVHFSPDGSTVLSASDDFSLILSDTRTGEEVRRFTAHNSRVTDSAFTPDGVTVFSASSAGEIYQWDVLQSSEKREYVREQPNETSLSTSTFSPGGSFILVSLDDGSLTTWDAAEDTVTQEYAFGRPEVPQTYFTLSPLATDDNLIGAWGSTDVRIVNMTTQDQLLTITETQPRAFVRKLAFSPDGSQILWGGGYFFREVQQEFSRAGLLTLWDVATGDIIQRFDAHNLLDDEGNLVEGVNRAVTAVAFTPNGTNIVSGAEDGTIYVWDVASGERLRAFTGHADRINDIQFSRDGKLMLSASADRAAILWDFETGQLLRRLTGHTGSVNSVKFNRSETAILTGSQDSRMIIWDVETGQSLQQFSGSTAPIVSASFSPDQLSVLSGALNGDTTLWAIDTALQVQEWARINRYVPEFTCNQRVQFRLPPCDADGNPPQPTQPPSQQATAPETVDGTG